MSIKALYPFSGSHAVQSAAFALEWQQLLTEVDLLELQVSLKAALGDSLPHVQTTEQTTFAFTPNASRPVAQKGINSLIFSRAAPNRITGRPSRALEVSRDKCVVAFNDYTRWNPVWTDAFSWLGHVAKSVGSKRAIKTMGLQFVDVFHWREAPEKMNINEILNKGSTYVPAHVFELTDLWHAHHGYVNVRTAPVPHKLLENVNINVADENAQRSILITTVHKLELDKPVWGADEVNGLLASVMPELHERNKAVLKDILSEEVCELIKLFGGTK